MQSGDDSTLTSRFAAIQIKMWHIQLRMRQVYENQKNLNSKKYNTNRERIKGFGPAIYSVVDMLVTFEHLEVLMSDILGTKEILGGIGESKERAQSMKREKSPIFLDEN